MRKWSRVAKPVFKLVKGGGVGGKGGGNGLGLGDGGLDKGGELVKG